jgi:hypothetical protein
MTGDEHNPMIADFQVRAVPPQPAAMRAFLHSELFPAIHPAQM